MTLVCFLFACSLVCLFIVRLLAPVCGCVCLLLFVGLVYLFAVVVVVFAVLFVVVCFVVVVAVSAAVLLAFVVAVSCCFCCCCCRYACLHLWFLLGFFMFCLLLKFWLRLLSCCFWPRFSKEVLLHFVCGVCSVPCACCARRFCLVFWGGCGCCFGDDCFWDCCFLLCFILFRFFVSSFCLFVCFSCLLVSQLVG